MLFRTSVLTATATRSLIYMFNALTRRRQWPGVPGVHELIYTAHAAGLSGTLQAQRGEGCHKENTSGRQIGLGALYPRSRLFARFILYLPEPLLS